MLVRKVKGQSALDIPVAADRSCQRQVLGNQGAVESGRWDPFLVSVSGSKM